MTEWLVSALATYGVVLLFLTTFFSCLALPFPASLLMLTGGAFIATGDLTAAPVVLSALFGALAGDQVGYQIGHRGRASLQRLLARSEKRQRLFGVAETYLIRWGNWGVFLSRWLFSPLGPYVNFASGIAALPWLRYTVFGAAGEVVWVSLYVGLGYVFAGNITMAAELAGDALGLIAAVTTMGIFGFWIWRNRRKTKSAMAE